MKASVENKTRWPLRSVRAVVWWVLEELGVNRPDVVVRVDETTHWYHHGGFYYREEADGRLTKLLITAHVPPEPYGGHDRGLRGGPPPIYPETWREALVCIVAHEGEHLRQILLPVKGEKHKGYRWKRVGGKLVKTLVDIDPRRFSEVGAEWAEYRLLARWRKEKKR